MSHVVPHRFADLFAGKLDDDDRDAIERHCASCASCATARARVLRASNSFAALRAQPAPDIAWDAIRARVHWSVSSERRARLRPRRPLFVVAGAVAAVAGVVAILAMRGAMREPDAGAPIVEATPPRQPVASPPTTPVQLAGLVSRLAGEVMIDGRADLFDRTIGVGTVLATGDGRIDVQFGDASAFALGPRSTVELRRFDAAAVELVVEGTVDITVAPRTAGQRFVVRAGAHAIEVRGTQFRVVRDGGATKVECRHGLVVVRDGGGAIDVASARAVEVGAGRAVADARVVAMSADALARLERATPATMPMWGDADAVARASAPLEVASAGKREVRIDGVELGEAPLRVRVLPGRHTVEAAERGGRFRRIGWVDVATTAGKPARLDVPAEVAPSGGAAVRKQQLHARMDRARLAACTRDVTNAGIGRTYVAIEIGVDPSGAINFLNLVDTDLGQSSAEARCVHDVLADVRFGAGPSASWQERIEL